MTALSDYTDFLQVANGALSVVLASMMIIFLHHIWRKWLVWRTLSSSFYADTKPAVSVFVFVLGDGIIRGVIWYAQFVREPWTGNGPRLNAMLVVLLVGVATAAIGGLCVVRSFSPVKYKWLTWSLTAIAMIVFSVATWPR